VCHTSTAHHETPAAKAGDCVSCHGDVVTNPDDGHYIPTYDQSQVTPTAKDGDGLPLNNRTNGAGACNYCHDDDGKFAGDGSNPDERIIRNNFDLHHGQGFTDCGLCHVGHSVAIRDCERCHGVDSLHNIQADSPNPDNIGTIVAGEEDAGYGHVGRDAGAEDSDCWGCHGFAKAASAPLTVAGPVIPTLYNVDVNAITAGADTAVFLSGIGFTNTSGGRTYESDVRLTAADGSKVMLEPDSVSQATVAVTIPGHLAPGNYKVQAVKEGVASNPAVISIVPAVTISSVTADGTMTISGSGFGGYAEGSGTSVTWPLALGLYRQSMAVPATIVSWDDTQIVVDFRGASPEEVVVNSIFGVAAADVEEVSQPEPEPQPEPETDTGKDFSFRREFSFGLGEWLGTGSD
jgi:hypothetical protein